MNDPWVIGALLGVALAVGLSSMKVVTISGALAGALLTATIMGEGGYGSFALFALLVVGGSAVSRREAGRRTRRDAWQALANAGPACVFLLLLPGPAARIAAMASFGAAFSDTVSSELGQRGGRSPVRLLLVGPAVSPGSDGGMTLVGTAYGVAAAVVAGLIASLFALPALGVGVAVGAGSLAGNLVDSLLGATLEPRLPRAIGNNTVNALAAASGGGIAWWLLTSWVLS